MVSKKSPAATHLTWGLSISHKHLRNPGHNPISPAPLVPLNLSPLPPKIPIPAPLHTRPHTPAATSIPAKPGGAAGHPDRLSHQPDPVARAGLGGHAHHPLEAGGQAQAEAGQEGGEEAPRHEGHDDEGEDLEGVALGVVEEVAEEAADAAEGALDEGGAGGALVVGGRAGAFFFVSSNVSKGDRWAGR